MSIVILGDTHHPFSDKEALKKAYEIIAAMKPDHVVQIGDLYDFISFSKFPRNPNFITPEVECRTGREDAEEMWSKIKRASPRSKRWQLSGNHDVRPVRYVANNRDSALHVLRKFVKDMMTFDGVELVDDEHVIEGVAFEHGSLKAGLHAFENNQSTVVGHSHRPGVYCLRNRAGPFFELNVGCMIDLDSEAFDYRAKKKMHKMTVALGIIDHLGPRYVCL